MKKNRGFWRWREGRLVPLDEIDLEVRTTIMKDEMEPTRHPADGRLYTSKKRFRETTRAAGCVEIGDQKMPPPRQYEPSSAKADLLASWNHLADGRKH